MPITAKNLLRFKNAVKKLNSVIADCKRDCADDEHTPFAYMDGNDSLSLLSGELGIGEDGVHDTILATGTLNAQSGDW